MPRPFFVALTLLVLTGHASAQPIHIVTPNIYTNAEGPGSSNVHIAPLNNPRTVQVILNENQLTGLINHHLTGVTYRLTNIIPGPYPLQTTTWADYSIRLGPSVAPVNASPTFANNFIAASTLVRTGPLTVPPFAWPQGSPPNPSPWGIEILFQTPYLYTGGHLAFQLIHPGSDNPSQGNSLLNATGMASPGQGIDFRNVVATSNTSPTGVLNNFSTVMRFTAIAAVPEPGTLLLTGVAGLLAAGWVIWKRQRVVEGC
jgi:hypothetical protein